MADTLEAKLPPFDSRLMFFYDKQMCSMNLILLAWTYDDYLLLEIIKLSSLTSGIGLWRGVSLNSSIACILSPIILRLRPHIFGLLALGSPLPAAFVICVGHLYKRGEQAQSPPVYAVIHRIPTPSCESRSLPRTD